MSQIRSLVFLVLFSGIRYFLLSVALILFQHETGQKDIIFFNGSGQQFRYTFYGSFSDMELFQRVLSLKPYFGTKTKMAEVLGISYRMLDNYLRPSSQVHLYPLLPKIIAYLPELNRSWLYFGEGLPNLDKAEVQLEDSADVSCQPQAETNLADVVARQSKTIEHLAETNRLLMEQLLKQNLKGE